jgi:hypothetical protein
MISLFAVGVIDLTTTMAADASSQHAQMLIPVQPQRPTTTMTKITMECAAAVVDRQARALPTRQFRIQIPLRVQVKTKKLGVPNLYDLITYNQHTQPELGHNNATPVRKSNAETYTATS